MATPGERIRAEREKRGWTQAILAEKLSITIGTLSGYERNYRQPNLEMLQKIASVLEVTSDYLLGLTSDPHGMHLPPGAWPVEKTRPIPILGVIRAGEPIYAEEHIAGYFPFPEDLLPAKDDRYFLLRVKGDSMVGANIRDNDLVLVKEQDWLDESGDVMVVILNGDEATVKRVYKQDTGLILQPENKNYQPIFIPLREVGEVRLVGKVVKVLADVK